MEGSRFVLVDEDGDQCVLSGRHGKVSCTAPRKGTPWKDSHTNVASFFNEAQLKRHVDLVERSRREQMGGTDEFSIGPGRTLHLHSGGEEYTCTEEDFSSRGKTMVCSRGSVRDPKPFALLPASFHHPERGIYLHMKARTPSSFFVKEEWNRRCGVSKETGVMQCPISSLSDVLPSFQVYQYVPEHRVTKGGTLETRSEMKEITECVGTNSRSEFRSCVDAAPIEKIRY